MLQSRPSWGGKNSPLNKAEAADAKIVTIGETNGQTNLAPLSTGAGVKESASEIIYTADELTLTQGDKITKIAFLGYKTTDPLERNLTVWVENTTDEAPGTTFKDMAGVQPVFDGTYTFQKIGTNRTDPAEILVVELASPLVYTGGNLRISMRSVNTTYAYNAEGTALAPVYFNVGTEQRMIYAYDSATRPGLASASVKRTVKNPIARIYYEEGTGDDTPGDDTPGGDTPGGDTPGGDTPGGQTEGGQHTVVIGARGAYNMSGGSGLVFGFRAFQSELLYPASATNMQAGDQIEKIEFFGYNSSSAVTRNVKVWIENTDDEAYTEMTFKPVSQLTQVLDADVTIEGGNAQNPVALLTISFATPFEYTGKSLRIAIESEGPSNPIYTERDMSDNLHAIRATSTSSLANLGTTGKTYRPVTAITYNRPDVPTAIEAVETTATSSSLFNLQGQRLNQKPQHGIYIINGRKYVANNQHKK